MGGRGARGAVCGGGSSPVPFTTPTTPSPGLTVTGTLSNTVSGAPIGPFSRTVTSLPAVLEFTAPGFYARTTRIAREGQDVDLLPNAGFDHEFYQQFARSRARI